MENGIFGGRSVPRSCCGWAFLAAGRVLHSTFIFQDGRGCGMNTQPFQDAIRAAGLQPPDVIEPGRFHKFPGEDKGKSNRAAWCKLFPDGAGGIFGDYSTGLSADWQAKRETPYTATEREAFKRHVAEAKATSIWNAPASALEATQPAIADHGYLKLKGIQPHGVKVYRGSLSIGDMVCNGALMIPMKLNGKIASLQFISREGEKRFLPNGEKGGYLIGKIEAGKPICIAEGFATGASIHEATGHAVVVAFDAGNLRKMAEALRAKNPDAVIVLCADDDYQTGGNPGLTKATEAARAVSGLLVSPVFGANRTDKATDFNDMATLAGLDAVKQAIDSAKPVVRETEAVGCDLSPSIAAGDAMPLPENAAQADAPPAQSDDEIIQWLASLKPLEYDRVRKEQATALKVRPGTLDGMVKAARSDESEVDRLPFAEVEPHPEPIDPAQLLSEVSDTIRQFIVLDTEQAHAAALWVAFTWFVDVVEVAPLAIISAPEKSCGKSQLLFLFGRMVSKPLIASNMRGATLFRIAEKWHPAILIDEADTFIKTDEDIAGLINAGHTRDGALAWRLVGDSFEPKAFNIWGAKALAGITLEKHLPDATMSRGIIFEMRRKLGSEMVIRLRDAEPGLFEVIASKLARFAADYSQQVKQARPLLPERLSDRAQDNWHPLLAIAACAGAEWVTRATVAALKLSGAGEETQSTGNELLADIQHIFESKKKDKINFADLIQALCDDEEAGWATYNRGKPITPRQVSKRLKEYGISSKPTRFGYEGVQKGFDVDQFADAFARYMKNPDFPVTQLQPNNGGASDVTNWGDVTVTQSIPVTPKPSTGAGCNHVTGKKPILGDAETSRSNTSHLRI